MACGSGVSWWGALERDNIEIRLPSTSSENPFPRAKSRELIHPQGDNITVTNKPYERANGMHDDLQNA